MAINYVTAINKLLDAADVDYTLEEVNTLVPQRKLEFVYLVSSDLDIGALVKSSALSYAFKFHVATSNKAIGGADSLYLIISTTEKANIQQYADALIDKINTKTKEIKQIEKTISRINDMTNK